MNADSTALRRNRPLPIGYYRLHSDVSVNFQLNRFYGWVGNPEMLAEMREAAEGLSDYSTFARVFLELGEKRVAAGDVLEGASYLRMAEFFLPADDVRKQPTRRRFIDLVTDYYGVDDSAHSVIPFASGWLSAYRFTPERPKGTVVVFGGFDSYIEEWLLAAFVLEREGYDVVLFEGPGQGTVLEEAGLHFTPEWDKPVGAVLDYYGLDDVTLMGFSMGGGLVLRAAAQEKRARRVICYGVLPDFLDAHFRMFPAQVRTRLRDQLSAGDAEGLNEFVGAAAKTSLLLQWGIPQGRHTTGKQTPFDIFTAYAGYETASVSPLVDQDVLLLHGNEDHYIPAHQLTEQIATLTNVRSLTARVFTADEQAQNHCQVGNYGLALHEIAAWLERLRMRDAEFAVATA
jgi:pimeloyl-ACP methyl ester carboxylesterase